MTWRESPPCPLQASGAGGSVDKVRGSSKSVQRFVIDPRTSLHSSNLGRQAVAIRRWSSETCLHPYLACVARTRGWLPPGEAWQSLLARGRWIQRHAGVGEGHVV